MNDKDLVEFFIYLRDHCYNRDFQMDPKRVVECFHEYRTQGYKTSLGDRIERDIIEDKIVNVKIV